MVLGSRSRGGDAAPAVAGYSSTMLVRLHALSQAVLLSHFARVEVGGLILRVLDAFRPRGATWSGQVISSPPGPSGDPFKTHLLPGCGVSRVHGAQSPVPPWLLLLATPR